MTELGDLAAFKDLSLRTLHQVVEAAVRVTYPPFSTVHVQGYPVTRLVVPVRGQAAGVSFDAAYNARSAVRIRRGSVAVSLLQGAEDRHVFALGEGLETIEVPLQALQGTRRLPSVRSRDGQMSPAGFADWVPDLLVLWRHLGGRSFARALDVGTGVGNMSILLAPLCGELVSSDVGIASLRTARAQIASRAGKLPSLVCADAQALPFSDESMDLVASRLAAHHFASIPSFVSEAARVLRRGGVLALSDLYVLPEDGIDALNTIERACDSSHVAALSEFGWLKTIDRDFDVWAVARTRMPLGFGEWMKRFGHDDEQISGLSRWILRLAPALKAALGVKVDGDGRVASFLNHRIVVLAKKR